MVCEFLTEEAHPPRSEFDPRTGAQDTTARSQSPGVTGRLPLWWGRQKVEDVVVILVVSDLGMPKLKTPQLQVGLRAGPDNGCAVEQRKFPRRLAVPHL